MRRKRCEAEIAALAAAVDDLCREMEEHNSRPDTVAEVIAKLDVGMSDVIVATVRGNVGPDQAHQLRAHIKSVAGEHIGVIVLSDAVRLSVVAP